FINLYPSDFYTGTISTHPHSSGLLKFNLGHPSTGKIQLLEHISDNPYFVSFEL
ncbi:6673_t:CDS:1, partial [Cetraspora pellucida]